MQKPKKPRLIKSRIRKLAQVPVVKTEVSKSHVPKIKRNKENGQEKVCIKQSHEITILTLPESNSKSQKPLKINEINLLLGAILATFQNFKESIKAIIHSWVVATQISFIFIPKPWEMIQFDEHIFQMSWLNHQLDSIEVSWFPRFAEKNPTSSPFISSPFEPWKICDLVVFSFFFGRQKNYPVMWGL